MTAERIRRLYDAKPFAPFVLHLANSREIPAPQRKFISISPSGKRLAVAHADSTFDVMVTSIATINVKTKRNGKRK